MSRRSKVGKVLDKLCEDLKNREDLEEVPSGEISVRVLNDLEGDEVVEKGVEVIKDRNLMIRDRDEKISGYLEKLLTSTLNTFTVEELESMSPRERVYLVTSFIEKMRLLSGESTNNVSVSSFVSLVKEISGNG